jgi:hypothetical protein
MTARNDRATREREGRKIDEQLEESFPTSDPPSFMGGKHITGAPPERKSPKPSPHRSAVKDAEKKVKTGQAKDSTRY